MMAWLRRMLEPIRRVDAQFRLARAEHLRVVEKAARALPAEDAIRAEVRRAERAMRGESR